jgi:hypothetical protein
LFVDIDISMTSKHLVGKWISDFDGKLGLNLGGYKLTIIVSWFVCLGRNYDDSDLGNALH